MASELIQSLSGRQEQRQVQGMAPRLLTALKHLQMGREELGREVAAELMRNPALESETEGEWRAGGGGDGLLRTELERGLAPREVSDDGADEPEAPEDPEDDWRQRQLDSLAARPSLYEHLAAQLDGVRLTPGARLAAMQVIGNLDANGWLPVPLAEVAREAGVGLAEAEEGLRAVQGLEPCGVGGRGLGECLLLQLRDRGLAEDSWPVRLVRDHLAELGARELSPALRRMGLDAKGWAEAKAVVRSLDPRPGAQYSTERTVGVQPDVEIVAREGGGGYEARLLDDGVPRLRISRRYEELLQDPATGAEALAFLREKIRSGRFLMGSIEQRRATLQKIGQLIAETQGPFLDEGVAALRAVTLEQAGKALGLHATTVGRATAGKYVRTPQGVKPMRFFFSAGGTRAAGDGGETVALAPAAVKDELRRLVGGEDPARPLSDDALAKALARRGLRVARRTVAKYREQARIPSSHERRRQGGRG